MYSKIVLIALYLFLLPSCLLSGSADAVIKCKSGSGRTVLHFLDQDIQGTFQGGTFSIDGKSIVYAPSYSDGESNDYSRMIVNMKEGVYTLNYQDKKHHLAFYALPNSVHKIPKEGFDDYYRFSAVVDWRSTDPRSTEWDKRLKKQIWLGCTLSYGI
jgi:hypothetical protein